MKKIALLLLALALIPSPAMSKNAEVMLMPTRMVLEKNEYFGTVVVKNTGDAPGDYRISLADMKMQENGGVVPYAQGETPQYSALPFLHAAPSSMTLKPGQWETIHVVLRQRDKMETGEYRSHLQVRLVHANSDEAAANAPRGIVVKTDVVLSVPIIIRNGAQSLKLGIEQPKLSHDEHGTPTVEFYLTRSGNVSSMGDVAVTCGGHPIKLMAGQAMYRPLEKRFFSIPLDETPADVDLKACRLHVAYKAQRDHGGKTLTEADVNTP